MADEQRSFQVPEGRCLSVAPGLPTTDMARTIEHYRRLGFTFSAPGSSSPAEAGFAIATRDEIELHFAVKNDHDPARTATWVYIGVEDADAISEEFIAAGAGQGRPVRSTDYKMRELAHIDPDGNLLLFGSPLPRDPQDSAGQQAAGEEGAGQEAGGGQATGQEADRQPGRLDTETRVLADGDRAAFELLRAVKRGDAEQLTLLLDADPGLASCWINSCTPLHHFADAPGHRPNAAAVVNALVTAGADLNAHARDTWHHETPLHWAASNDDVALIDALLDAGADIEHPGSSIDGGPPIQSALGYAQWAAVRRLRERGATAGLSHAAVLGLMETVISLVEADPAADSEAPTLIPNRQAATPTANREAATPNHQAASPVPNQEDICVAFWNACRAGQTEVARYLLSRGAELDWPAPWDGSTPLDAATGTHQRETVAWLRDSGAHSGDAR